MPNLGAKNLERAQLALRGGLLPPCVFVFSCFRVLGQLTTLCFRVFVFWARWLVPDCVFVFWGPQVPRSCCLSGSCRPLSDRRLPPVGPLSLSLITASFLHGAHHLAVLLVEGVGHAGVLLEVNLGDQLDIQRPGAWCRENSYCKIGNKDEGMAKKSQRPIF